MEMLCCTALLVLQYNPFGDLQTHGPDENRIVNKSNGSLIAVRWVTLLLNRTPHTLVGRALLSVSPSPYNSNHLQLRGTCQRREAQHAGRPSEGRLPRHSAGAGTEGARVVCGMWWMVCV